MSAVAQLNAALAGRYTVEREIGRGGMATVFLATDLRHHRKVALKLLDPELGAVLGAERFLSEIRVTANLQHPNLLPLFDSGEAGGLLFYVMPYIEGETLRHRLEREKQLPIDEAVHIASSMASALDYAHRHGVIHRDLKPENVLLHDGQPLIADFGIALAVSNAGGARVTQTGLSLGTPQYMSPEQATGDRNVDGRTDIYSLGALTYEMLAGEPPHSGTTAQAIIARLMTEDPRPLSVVRRSVPAQVEGAVRCALEKLPADRFATAKEFADALHGRGVPLRTTTSVVRTTRVRRAIPWTVAAIGVATAAGLGGILWSRAAEPPATPVRFRIEPPEGLRFSTSPAGMTLAISRDGQSIAYLAGPSQRLYLRRLSRLDEAPVGMTERLSDLRFSPDGKWIGFKGADILGQVATDGGAQPITLKQQSSWNGMGWTYGPDLVYALNDTIWRLGRDGSARVISGADTSLDRLWNNPIPLPDGKSIALRVTPVAQTAGTGAHRLGIISTEGGARTLIDVEADNVIGVIDDILIYGHRSGRVMAVPFDLGKRKLLGQPVTMLDGVLSKVSGVSAVLSDNGTLAYITMSNATQLEIVDERGNRSANVSDGRTFLAPQWSPDGTRLAVLVADGEKQDVWVYDIRTRVLSRLTQRGLARTVTWTPDGRRIAFISSETARASDSTARAMWLAADGSELPVPVPGTTGLGKRSQSQVAFTPDGRYSLVRLVSNSVTPLAERRTQVFAVPIGGGTPSEVLRNAAATPFAITASPNGKWLVYRARVGSRDEVFAAPFLGGSGRVQISANGGTAPQWTGDGRGIVYLNNDSLWVATLDAAVAMPRVTETRTLGFAGVGALTGGFALRPDARQLALTRPTGAGARIVVVTNWMTEVKAKLAER